MRTVVLLRHADIDPPPETVPDDWPLNAKGKARAKTLAHVAGNAGVTAIYVSEALRTQQTVAPLAAKLGLEPKVSQGPPTPEGIKQVLTGSGDGTIVIAGHSNTIPEMIE